MRIGSQPAVVGVPENPWPGSDGITTIEGVVRARAVRLGVGERADDLELLDDRAGPPVRDDEGQRVVMLRPHVDEVDVDAVDLGHELRQGLEPGLDRTPVVLGGPVVRQLSHRFEPNALRFVVDGLLLRPPHRRDAPTEIVEVLLRNVDTEGADRALRCSVAHLRLLPRRIRRASSVPVVAWLSSSRPRARVTPWSSPGSIGSVLDLSPR